MDHDANGMASGNQRSVDFRRTATILRWTAQARRTSSFREAAWHAKEKLYAFLESRSAGADAAELAALLFSGAGSDPELAPRIVRHLLGGDPNFAFDPLSGLWSVRKNDSLKIPIDEARYVVVDLETTGGPAAPGSIIEIGAYRMDGVRIADSFQTLIRPRMRIPRFVTALTSITNEMVAKLRRSKRSCPPFATFSATR